MSTDEKIAKIEALFNEEAFNEGFGAAEDWFLPRLAHERREARMWRCIAATAILSVILLVAAILASIAHADPPLPQNPAGKHATNEAAQNQRIRDLNKRVDDTEAVVAWVRHCLVANTTTNIVYQKPGCRS